MAGHGTLPGSLDPAPRPESILSSFSAAELLQLGINLDLPTALRFNTRSDYYLDYYFKKDTGLS